MKRAKTGLAIAWMVAIATVVAVQLAARAWAPDPTMVELDVARLPAARNGAVVFLGTSLTACAVPYDSQFEAFGVAAGLHLDFVRLAKSSAVQEDFIPILEDIQASKAEWILIEAEMLLRAPSPMQQDVLNTVLTRFRAPIRLWLGNLVPGVVATFTPDTPIETFGCPDRAFTDEAFQKTLASPRRLRSAPWRPEWVAFIDEAKRSGKKIVLVSIGRSAALERRIDPGYVRGFERNLQEAVEEFDLQLWVFDAQGLPEQDFSDGAHMNAAGRAVFTPWLARQLAAAHAAD